MNNWILLYCSLYIALFFICIKGIKRFFLKSLTKNSSTIQLDEITLLIPFRNEEKRIVPLLNALNNSSTLPHSILFIDDHSTDKTVEVIQSSLKIDNYSILHSVENGKKAAIHYGVYNSKTAFILTMDADVTFEASYFDTMSTLQESDLIILPVKMKSSGWQKIVELDIYLLNVINIITAGFKRPIVSSGANLLFKKSTFIEVNSYKMHRHVLSGDDQFLLADFVKNKKETSIVLNNQLAVTTPSPTSLPEFLDQRLRWIQKTPHVKDKLAMIVGFIQLFITFSFISLVAFCLIKSYYIGAIELVLIKVFIDYAIVEFYLKELQKRGLLLQLFVYELLFPFYTLLLGLISVFYKPEWKGRETFSNK
ncbi:MAG: glycosyltransferase [Crocinitomicaceae bacterium]|nr:glycosyltransferase [Crocinitomicaceae bacterium]